MGNCLGEYLAKSGNVPGGFLGILVVFFGGFLRKLMQIPDGILARFRKRKQYIFLLETIAQVLVLFLFWPELGPYYLSFVDNSASQWALTKGYSSDPDCNVIVGLFWSATGILGGFSMVPLLVL